MPENESDLLLAYLRQHGGRFVVEAMRRQMLSEGHDPALVEQAIRTYESERPLPPPRSFWPLALGIAFLNLAVVIAVVGIIAAFNATLPQELITTVLLILLAALVLEPIVGVVMVMVGGPIRRTGMGLLLGSVLFFSAVILLGGSVCLYFISQS